MIGLVVTKTVCQRSRELPQETMRFLRGIASDYAKVKTAVYERYSGIRNVNRLALVYTIQNEMRACGLRQQLNLPVVYYEMAVAEAVTNLKVMWSSIKDKIREIIRDRGDLSPDERMYLRTVLKLDSIFSAILNRRIYEMPHNVAGAEIDTVRMNNLLCRMVRRCLTKPKVHRAEQFKVTPAGYRYKDGGIYLVSRIPRRRVYLPLKDAQVSSRQIRVAVAENSVIIYLPVDIEVCEREDSSGTVYAYIGYRDALTLSNGNVYGKGLEDLVTPETERLCKKNTERNKAYTVYAKSQAEGNRNKAKRIARNNLGKSKYRAQKRRMRERTQNYINAEINRMFETEKPHRIVVAKLPTKNRAKSYVKTANRQYARSFHGYIQRRLEEKCRIRGIALVMISSKDTKSICSHCGAMGIFGRKGFHCPYCGYVATIAQNSAKNIEKKALAAGID